MKNKKIIAILLAFILFVCTACNGAINREYNVDSNKKCRVWILDVGQGSSMLVLSEGKYMMIDGGDSDKSSYVVSFLKKKGVETLEYIIATHYDSDHLNGVVGALNVFEVKKVICPEYTEDTRVYKSFENKINELDIEKEYAEVGNTYSLGEAEFEIIAPNADEYSDVNDYSVGIRFDYYESGFIVCGDATTVSEGEMVKSRRSLQSDIYIVNHHGSNGSTSNVFLNAINPEYAIISVGENNSYGHPGKNTLEKLEKNNVKIYRTDMQGEIEFAMYPNYVEFELDAYDGINAKQQANSVETSRTYNDKSHNVESEYILNTSSKKIHRPDCSAVNKMSKKNKKYFEGTLEEAIDDGYDKCQMCFGE